LLGKKTCAILFGADLIVFQEGREKEGAASRGRGKGKKMLAARPDKEKGTQSSLPERSGTEGRKKGGGKNGVSQGKENGCRPPA